MLLWQKVTLDLWEGCFCKASLKCVREGPRGADGFYECCSRHCTEQWALGNTGTTVSGEGSGRNVVCQFLSRDVSTGKGVLSVGLNRTGLNSDLVALLESQPCRSCA